MTAAVTGQILLSAATPVPRCVLSSSVLCCSASCSSLAAEESTVSIDALAEQPEASTSGSEIFETVDFYFRDPRGFQQAVEAVNPRQNLGECPLPFF